MENEEERKKYLETMEGILVVALLSTEGKYTNCQDRAAAILKLVKEKISKEG